MAVVEVVILSIVSVIEESFPPPNIAVVPSDAPAIWSLDALKFPKSVKFPDVVIEP